MDPTKDYKPFTDYGTANITATNILNTESTSCPAISASPSASPPKSHHPLPQMPSPRSQTELLCEDVDNHVLASRQLLIDIAVGGTASAADLEDFDSLNDVVIDDMMTETEPTSAMLHFCKRRFLRPFIHLLGVVGLRPMSVEASDCSFWTGHAQTLCVLTVLLFGYVLQFVASFRRDRGIWQGPQPTMTIARHATTTTTTTTELPAVVGYYSEMISADSESQMRLGETLFVYVVPGVLHACGFAMALRALRVVDNEHLQNLVERVFIQCAADRRLAAQIVAALWAYVVVGFVWLAMMTGGIVWPELMTIVQHPDNVNDISMWTLHSQPALRLRWFARPSPDALVAVRWCLLIVVFVHDLVQTVVITTYAIQCHLLRGHLENMRSKLMQNTIDPMDWMREMCEFRKLLHHLNSRIAAPVCWFTLMNLIYTLAALIYALGRYGSATGAPLAAMLTNAANVTLWLAVALYPFFQAAALTLSCQAAQSCGHQVRVRPFGHHNTSTDSLNAVLMYASSLRMSAKLFRMPIQGNYLFFVILCLVVAVLTLGMCLAAGSA